MYRHACYFTCLMMADAFDATAEIGDDLMLETGIKLSVFIAVVNNPRLKTRASKRT